MIWLPQWVRPNTTFSLTRVGTGSFGRVHLAKLKSDKEETPYALKMLKKSEIIRLKQVDHVKTEKKLLKTIKHPFIIDL